MRNKRMGALALILLLGGSAAADTVVAQGKMTGKLPDGSFWHDGGDGRGSTGISPPSCGRTVPTRSW